MKQLNLYVSDEIKVNSPDEPGRARIIAFSVWGVLRGMESFSQLVYQTMEFGNAVRVGIIFKSTLLYSNPLPWFSMSSTEPKSWTRRGSPTAASWWTPAGTTSPSPSSGTTSTWWRWTSTTSSTGTSRTIRPFLMCPKDFLISGIFNHIILI